MRKTASGRNLPLGKAPDDLRAVPGEPSRAQSCPTSSREGTGMDARQMTSSGGLVLSWHTATRHESERAAAGPSAYQPTLLSIHAPHVVTRGALALLEELPVPTAYHVAQPDAALPRVLLVQGDPGLAHALRSALELEDNPAWIVEVARGGVHALELAAANPPRVVLLDIAQPEGDGIDGVELYQRLRANPITRGTRMIFVSAATSLHLYERGVQDGVLVRKPVDMCDLVGLVRALLAE